MSAGEAISPATNELFTSVTVLTALSLVAWLLFSPPASGAGRATPRTLIEQIETAKGGATLHLTAGDYGRLIFPRRDFSPSLRLDAEQARFSGIDLTDVSGVEIKGGSVVGTGGRSYGIHIRRARDVRVEGMSISAAHRGIVVGASTRISIVGNTLTGLLSDGVDIALSSWVRVERNTCRNFNPTPALYDAQGRRLKDGDHPDCIQAWSRPHALPTSDLTIVDNDIEGRMQGIFLGNHLRRGVDDGGFDRIVIRDNRVRVGVPNGIVLDSARDCVVANNTVQSLPLATVPGRPSLAVKANLRVSGERNLVCGNRVPDVPDTTASKPCPATP